MYDNLFFLVVTPTLRVARQTNRVRDGNEDLVPLDRTRVWSTAAGAFQGAIDGFRCYAELTTFIANVGFKEPGSGIHSVKVIRGDKLGLVVEKIWVVVESSVGTVRLVVGTPRELRITTVNARKINLSCVQADVHVGPSHCRSNQLLVSVNPLRSTDLHIPATIKQFSIIRELRAGRAPVAVLVRVPVGSVLLFAELIAARLPDRVRHESQLAVQRVVLCHGIDFVHDILGDKRNRISFHVDPGQNVGRSENNSI